MKALLISIRPEHALNILNGSKTLELRKSVPKGYVGWVYVYVTKGKRLSVVHDDEIVKTYYYLNSHWGRELNQDIPCRFWFDEYDVILNQGSRFIVENKDEAYTNKLARESCLDYVDLKRYLKDKNGYAWHIKKLEIFSKVKNLEDFNLKRAPQSWCYINE